MILTKSKGILFSRNIFYRIYFLLIELTAKHIAAARQIVHVANCVRGGNSFIKKKSMLFAVKMHARWCVVEQKK
jgi:hypothetical protein